MRITGGIHGSRTLNTPKNNDIRPTSDKIRQAVFNMLNARGLIVDAIVIDAFSGTGALGLEALSQGATHCTFFDKNKPSFELTKQNVIALKEEKRSTVILCDATKLKPHPENIGAATLVFIDPPYGKDLVSPTINSLQENNWIQDECYFVIETAKDEIISSSFMSIINEKIYGDTKVTLANCKL